MEREWLSLQNHILNVLADDMYDYYSSCETAKQVCEALKKKYDIEEFRAMNYVVSHYLKFKMVDERFVEDQYHNFKRLFIRSLQGACLYMNNFKFLLLLTKF